MKTAYTVWQTFEQWALWLVVTGVSWLLLAAVTLGLLNLFAAPSVVETALLGLGLGALVGLAQWHFLLPERVSLGLWVALSAAATWLALLAGTLLLEQWGGNWMLIAALALGGLIVGAAQAYLLRAGGFNSLRWLLVTVAGWVAAAALGVWLLPWLPLQPVVMAERLVVTLGVGLLMLSYLSAVALVTLFPRRDVRESAVRTANWY